MKDIEKVLKLNEVEYPIVFNLNVMQAIQEEYGSLDAWGNVTEAVQRDENDEIITDTYGKPLTKEPDVKAVIFGFTEMINEGIDIRNEREGKSDPFLSQRKVGRILTAYGLDKATQLQNETVIESTQSEIKN